MVKQTLISDTFLIHNLSLLHKNFQTFFFRKTTRIQQTNVLLLLGFHHAFQITVLPNYYSFQIQILTSIGAKDLFRIIIVTNITKVLTNGHDLHIMSKVTFLFRSHKIQNAIHDYLIHLLNTIRFLDREPEAPNVHSIHLVVN